ncbi:MAG: Maf family nucleotide pyrophosphatase [Bacteroidales bacterium]|nr:Maf family nucleotide pyrophosphatase [Bacteroidales bacterium]
MLKDLLKNKRVVLASSSPRRRLLLEGLDLVFTVEVNNDIPEVFDSSMDINMVPEHLAKLKSSGFGRQLDNNEILVTADTLVLCEGKILGKPTDRSEAFQMLKMLSGNRHTVLTGVCIRDNCKETSFTSETIVYFRDLGDDEIYYYIDNYAPYDKAGAYGAQDWIGYAGISRIEGSYFNVMGLPIQRLYAELEKLLSD